MGKECDTGETIMSKQNEQNKQEQQDLIHIAFEHSLDKIRTQLGNIEADKDIILFSSNLAGFKDKSDKTYRSIRGKMFSDEKAKAYFANQVDRNILSQAMYKAETPYYISLTMKSKLLFFYIDIDMDIKDTNEGFINNRVYCQAFFISLATQAWHNFITAVTKDFPKAKTLNDILDNIDSEKLSNALNGLQKDIIGDLDKVQDSEYFTKTILPAVKSNINSIFDELQASIKKAQDKQYIQKIIRSLFIVAASVVDFDTKDILKSLAKKLVSVVDATLTGMTELIGIKESNDEVMGYSVDVSLMRILISQMAQMTYLCRKQFMNELLFYGDRFIDLAMYEDMIETSLPIQSTFIQGQISQNFVAKLPALIEETESYKNVDSEYSIININDKEYNLGKHVSQSIQNLRSFFFAEYTNMNSAAFIEMMKQKQEQEQKKGSSFKQKVYCFITEAPSDLNSGLTKDIMSAIGLTPDGYIKEYKNQQDALEGQHNPVIDYSDYSIKQDNPESNHIVLQLSPFIKLPDKLANEYRQYIKAGRLKGFVNALITDENLKEQIDYINSFFQTPQDIEEVIQKEKEFAKDFLQLIQKEIFDSIDKNKQYLKEYSPEEILSIVIALCVLKNDFTIKSFNNGNGQFQTCTIAKYGEIKILRKNAYMLDPDAKDKKIYVLVSGAQSGAGILNINTIANEIIKTKDKAEDDFYTNAFDIFTKRINELPLDASQKQEIQNLQRKEQELLAELKEDTDTQMIKNQINKISIQGIIEEEIIKALIPFVDYFSGNPRFLDRIIHYLAEYIFSKEVKNKSFSNVLKYIVTKELGILRMFNINKTIIKSETIKIYESYIAIMNKRALYIQQVIDIKYKITISKEISLNFLNKKELRGLSKDIAKAAISGLAQGFLVGLIKEKFPNYYEKIKAQYEYIYYKKFRYKYNLPYAVNRDKFITIPMKIYNAYMGFDLQSMIYGSRLCTGGLKHHSGIAYSYTPNKSNSSPNTAITKDYMIQKILGYILLDELRGISDNASYFVDDIEFFANGFNRASLNVLKTKKDLYKLNDETALDEFRRSEDNNSDIKAIDAYNACIDILSDLYNNNVNTQTKNTYDGKIKELAKYFKIIGQNNIKAMYVGIREEDSSTKTNTDEQVEEEGRPKFVGRLATTIIIEDGLWIG